LLLVMLRPKWQPLKSSSERKRYALTGIQAIPSVPALQTEQLCVKRWGVACMKEFSGRAMSELLQEGGSHGLDLLGDSVCRHRDERGARRRRKVLSRVLGRVAMEEGAP
jgi:hypothetical protein